MRIFTALGLLIAVAFRFFSKDLTSDEHVAIEALEAEIKGPSSDIADTETITEELGATCEDKIFEDSVKNTCAWYDDYPDLRCPYAETFEKNNLDARWACCGCDGGTRNKGNFVGTYYMKSWEYGTYLSITDSDVTFTERKSNNNKIKIEEIHGAKFEDKYALKAYNYDKYLTVYNGKVGVYYDRTQYEAFEIMSGIQIDGDNYYVFKNEKEGVYLAAANVRTANVVDSVVENARFIYERIDASEESNHFEKENLLGIN
eukprot:CAMPEP_0172493016 /NCGR_PEP_ID=MMETSP1066-20121228/24333_1 /TAXON_ID=671091 /ORGANISM="Coscinodiscus wailesii, Strain CCMP2513" /LENGTH=258 /DNA_ID=CAMNT_0013262951 /DNA_START=80 /DNA_END=857 /DNA_ORIENTATION=-